MREETKKRWEFGNDEWSGGGKESVYKHEQLEVVKGESRYSLRTREKVDAVESKASME